MRAGILGHVIPRVTAAEPAATQALRYLLETSLDRSEGMAGRFLDLVAGKRFPIGRIVSEWQYGNRARPDVAIYDMNGDLRVFVENKFKADLTRYQPVEYLKELRKHKGSVLAFIAPEDLIPARWAELKKHCQQEELEASETADRWQARVGDCTLRITSWRRVLKELERVAAEEGQSAIERDIIQLRGLTEQMRSDASGAASPDERPGVSFGESDATFPPLREDEPRDARAAARLLNYCSLIDAVKRRLDTDPAWDTATVHASGFGRYFRVHEKFDLKLRISYTRWRDSGITPLWCTCYGLEGRRPEVQRCFDRAQPDKKESVLHIPIRLATGVERGRVIDHAVEQMHAIANRLLELRLAGE